MKPESKEFLITEFNNTYQEWRRTRDAGYSRIQFLLGISTAVLGGLGVTTQLKNVKNWDIGLFSLIGFSFLCLIAFQTSEYMFSRAIASDLNTRALARIRRYFIDNDPSIAKNLTWQTDDGPTKLFLVNGRGGLFRTTQIMFCIFIAGALSSVIFLMTENLYYSLISFGGWLLSAYLILHKATTKRLAKAWDAAEKKQRFSKLEENESETVFSSLKSS